MTRKYIRLIVMALHATKPASVNNINGHYDAGKAVQWMLDVRGIGEMLKPLNPRFDFDRFVKECNEGIDSHEDNLKAS